MAGIVIIPDLMEQAMKRDLDALRDSLPKSERPLFEKERHVHRQVIIDHFAEHGSYPKIDGIERNQTNDQ